MDLSTLIGLILGVASLILGFVLEGGKLHALLEPTAAIIVFGGTFGATILSFPFKTLGRIPEILKYAFMEKKANPEETIDLLVEISNISRREGLLALEAQIQAQSENPFLKDGIQMIVDGVEAEMIEDILTRQMERYEENKLSVAKVFETAAGFAPTMGIIGTVMGLVHVLGGLSNPSSLGPAIAVAFIATLYGVSSANLLYLPLANKVKARISQEILIMELQTEGLMSVQYGENSNVLRSKLMAFLDSKSRNRLEKGSVEDNG